MDVSLVAKIQDLDAYRKETCSHWYTAIMIVWLDT